ncbi:MAG: hypothetical protein V1837_06400 [Candidatus Woesearchaeota archaeon]
MEKNKAKMIEIPMIRLEAEDFLSLVDKCVKEVGLKSFLVERYKSSAQKHLGGVSVQVNNLETTTARALRWDYLLGDDIINRREFILANHRYATKFVEIKEHQQGLFYSKFANFVNRTYRSGVIEAQLATSNLERKMEVTLDHNYRFVRIEAFDMGKDMFYNSVLRELEKLNVTFI